MCDNYIQGELANPNSRTESFHGLWNKFSEVILKGYRYIFHLKFKLQVQHTVSLWPVSTSIYWQALINKCVFCLCLCGRKRKGWSKRRRRQSGTKSSLKTLPKEDDSDDACERPPSLSFSSQCPSAITLMRLHVFRSAGLISSSESSDGDDSDPESSNSGDSTFSEDINKMVKSIGSMSIAEFTDQQNKKP